MPAAKFDISYLAGTQIALLPREEKAALIKLFSTDAIDQSETTIPTDDGRFVSRLGTKRVLWHRSPGNKPEIISLIDQSFARTP